MTGLERIHAERKRVIEEEGFTPQTDRLYKIGELFKAAECYEWSAKHPDKPPTAALHYRPWPWEPQFFKASTAERNLEKAGQLYMAECERLNFLIDDIPSPMLKGHYQGLRNRAADGLQRCIKALDEMAKVTA